MTCVGANVAELAWALAQISWDILQGDRWGGRGSVNRTDASEAATTHSSGVDQNFPGCHSLW